MSDYTNNKRLCPVFPFTGQEDDEERMWRSDDYLHEISNKELEGRLSDKFWRGVLLGMFITAVSFAVGTIYFL